MKINATLKQGLIALAFTVISCDKQETETEFPKETVLEEGFKSTTGNSDSDMEVSSHEPSLPLLHMSYDASLSEEQATAKYQKEVSKLQKEVGQTNKSLQPIYYTIRTKTGNSANAATDGYVNAYVFLRSNSRFYSEYCLLNNRGNDREKGQWDFYTFSVPIDSSTFEWIELNAGVLNLKGTDGWYVARFDLIIDTSQKAFKDHTFVGGSTIKTTPRIWLDSNTNNVWDVYRTTNMLTKGRLRFSIWVNLL